MVKSELVTQIAGRTCLASPRDVERAIDAVLDAISKALTAGQRVELRGFGAFKLTHRPAREGRDPRNGKPVQIEQKRQVLFRCGKSLRGRLNERIQGLEPGS